MGRKGKITVGEVYYMHQREFREIFGHPLSMFWDQNHGGFLLQAFCTQVLEYDGLTPYVETTRQFGGIGRRLIREIMRDTAALW